MDSQPTTIDGILNKRVTLEQPVQGYRVAVDTVLLAAAVPALVDDKIIDLGCGVGGAMIALACRVSSLSGLGVEIQPAFADLCRKNIARNNFAKNLSVREADVTQLPSDLRGGFDHALMNPPYHDEARHDVSENAATRAANSDKSGDLALWIASAAQALKPSGSLTIIHRADRRDEILSLLENIFGDAEILPLVPRDGETPKRVIIRARKEGVFTKNLCKPLVLHKESGAYSEEAEAILRHAQPLAFQSP